MRENISDFAVEMGIFMPNHKLPFYGFISRELFRISLLPVALIEIFMGLLFFLIPGLQQERFVFAALCLILLFNLLLSLYILRRSRHIADQITSPLADISKASLDIGSGEYRIRLNRYNVIELDDLADNFETIAHVLKYLHNNLNEQLYEANKAKRISMYMEKELHSYRKYLEDLVKARTDELMKANESLKQEIEERKIAETELSRTKGYLDNVINSMPSVIIGIDPDGNITEWNLFAEKETGVSAAHASGRPLSEVLRDYDRHINDITRSLPQGNPVKKEKVSLYKNGEIRYKDIIIYPLVSNGASGAVLRIDDVTEKVRLEEMMIESEKMMSLGGLAAGMAHEINNPLCVILQAVQTAARRLSPDLEANIRAARECGADLDTILMYLDKRGIFRYIDGIKDAGTRASNIVSDMLSFARSSESHKPENLNKLMDKILELAAKDTDLTEKYGFENIPILREYDPELPDVPCNQTEIEQVFFSLLRNSVHAVTQTTESGKSPRIFLRTKQSENYIRIEFEDNGPGMDENTRKRIFEPFYTTKGVGQGTGLSLSVAYFIITHKHKGTISAESGSRGGAKFLIRLPLR